MMTSPTKGNIMYSDAAAIAQVFGVESISVPLGTRDVPALTCRDLAKSHPNLQDGLYWVDPNGGGPEDAIHVYCNFKTKETCIDSNQAVYSAGAEKQSSTDDFTWLGEVADYGNLLYKVEGTQLVMLKARSLGAHQTLTVSCAKGLKLYSDNEIELTSNEVHAKFSVTSNTCQNNSGLPKEVVLDVYGPPLRLPVRDVAFAVAEAKMNVRVGQVCFQ